MPTIKLTDQFGLDVDVATGDLSSLTKYFRGLSSLSLSGFNLQSIAGLTLADPAIQTLTGGLNFDQPVSVGAGGVTLQLDAGVTGALNIFVPPPGGGKLFDPDQFGGNIPVDAAERYVFIKLGLTAGPQAGDTVDKLCLGFKAGVGVTLANYRRFETQPAPPTILAAVEDTLANLCMPVSIDDLKAMEPGSVVTADGTGTLTCCASATLAPAANPLATVTLPDSLPALDVSAGGSVSVAASFGIDWEYEVRLIKVDANVVSLGFYRKTGTDTSVSVTLSEGVTAEIGGQDLLSALMGAMMKGASLDSAALAGMGVPAPQIDAMQSALKASVQRKLQVALTAGLTSSNTRDAAFLYEFDLSALDQTGAAALAAALNADVSGLSGALPAGVRAIRDAASEVSRSGVTWKINLLGIYNYISVTELVSRGAMVFDPATGDLTLTDTETASSIAAATVAFGADTARLRHLLAQNFLVTAVYRGSQAIVSPPELKCSQSFFESSAATGADAMQGELNVASALGLLDPAVEQALLTGAGGFGQTTAYAETSYDDVLAKKLFLSGLAARPQSDFETAGRQAIALLVRPGAADDYRLGPATDDSLWAAMSSAGQFNFGPLFPRLTQQQVLVIASDYTLIVWWAGAMASCAQRLAVMQAQLAAGVGPSTPQFKALRTDLANHLAKVASQTRDEFGLPWGLVAMDRASGGIAAARVQIAGTRLSFAASRPTAVAAVGAGG